MPAGEIPPLSMVGKPIQKTVKTDKSVACTKEEGENKPISKLRNHDGLCAWICLTTMWTKCAINFKDAENAFCNFKGLLEERIGCFTFNGFNGCFKIASIGIRKS